MKFNEKTENLFKLIDEKILSDRDYLKLNTFLDKHLFENYALLGELLNPDNAYPYIESNLKGMWVFTDEFGFDYFVRIYYTPSNTAMFELKMGWVDLDKQEKYLRQSARGIDERRSDTIAKIYRDEILPFFKKMKELSNTLVIKPNDIKRYQFSIRLVQKFTPNEFEIIEDKPTKITIKIKNI
jgi:hypothetical protein